MKAIKATERLERLYTYATLTNEKTLAAFLLPQNISKVTDR